MNIVYKGDVYILKHMKLCGFGFGFCLHPNHLQLCFEYKKKPHHSFRVFFSKQLVLTNTLSTVHDSFKPDAAAASCLLFLYSLFLFSHCFLPGFVTGWFRDLVFFWLSAFLLQSVLIEALVGVKDGRDWTLLSCGFFETIQADLKSSIYYNTGCKPDSLGS